MIKPMGAAVLAACVAVGCTTPTRRPVPTGAGTLQGARQYLTLISYEVFPPGRPGIQLKGTGLLTYDEFGNLDMEIRVSDPKVADELRRAGVPLEKGVISTTGRTSIDLQSRTLTYFLQGDKPIVSTADAGPLAMNRPRHWDVQGNVLTLTVKNDSGEPMSVGRWQKSQ
jgi:hypothetical protein